MLTFATKERTPTALGVHWQQASGFLRKRGLHVSLMSLFHSTARFSTQADLYGNFQDSTSHGTLCQAACCQCRGT